MSKPTREPSSHSNDPSAAAPNTATVEDDLLAALADDFSERVRRQERPLVEEYAAKHPELADRIRKLFPTIALIEDSRTIDTAATAGSEGPGSIIGRYKLLERIGEGGFGVVYMAEQQHPVRRKVALKVIKPGIDTRQVIARFEVERQALALMEHENIAKVLDAGATDSGRPYFAMELVRGVPITEFCDKNDLAPRERLELFVVVCRAVQHAHTKGIIHRDIKPTNVLVTLHEGIPVPKVIDFGVAKATGQQLTDKTLFTQFAQMVGTPLYMSPEQAEMTSIDVDTRSDVYSLGVLLYELLTGTTPLNKERLKSAAFDEVRRIIREDDPPRPSVRLSTLGQQAGRSISAHRKNDVQQLRRIVRGELDWIVMKALEKERARRYETASAFASDVERYLRDEPVEACPPSAWYRFRKFARRRKAALGVLSGIALLVLAGAVILAISNVRVSSALHKVTDAKAELETALDRERVTLERERRNSYSQRIALANREWSANNLSRMEELLDECPADLCGWEWHYLKRLRFSLHPLRHESPVLSVTFSPDGQYVATGTLAGELRLWQTKDGRECRRWPAHQESAHSVVFSPDGRYLASGGWDGLVNVWEMEKVLQGEVSEPLLQLEHESWIRSVAFSPDGRRLAVASGRAAKEFGEVKIWNMNTRRDELTLKFSTQVDCVQFSPDGRRIATVDPDSLALWDADASHEHLIWREHEKLLLGVAFSPDGRRLATVGGGIALHPDPEIKIWNAETGQAVRRLRGHVGGLRSVAFSPDGRHLASCGLDQTVKLWDTASWEEVLTLRIWDATPLDGEPTPENLTLRGHAGAVTDVAFHPNGSSLVSAGMDGMVQVWNVRSGEKRDTLHVNPRTYIVRVAYSPDGRQLAVASGESGRTAVTIWETASAQQLESFPGTGAEMCVAFSPDGRHVASAGMASANMKFDVRIREATTGHLLRVVQNHDWPIFGLAFSPDGSYLASCSSDGTVRICNWKTGEQLTVLQPRSAGRVAGVAFSLDGQWLASANWDRTVRVWKTSTWELLHDLPDSTGAALCVAFGPDRRLVWGSKDGTIKVWDGPDSELHVLRGHTSWVQAVSVSADGERIASASLDGTVKIWPAPPKPKPVDQGKQNAEK
jgi:WD40 repeat protein/serine/threonine protein kinase